MSNGTSGSYFSLKDNEEALIRILYNSYEDVKPYYDKAILEEYITNYFEANLDKYLKEYK